MSEKELPFSLHVLRDCTWCKHRKRMEKAIQNRYELETCMLTGKKCAPPHESRRRTCENYQQIGCECAACTGTGS